MKTIKVWDPIVRFFHWALVAGVVVQLATAEDYQNVHAVVGHIIVLLLVIRIIWGVVGTTHARFADFVYPPADILAYLKGLVQGRPKHYIGHNPAGGAMICALLFFLMLSSLAGLKTLDTKGKGLLAVHPQESIAQAWADDHPQRSDDGPRAHVGTVENGGHGHFHGGNHARVHFWKEIHETLVGITLLLVGLHICGVLASSFVHRENLILAMITGKKKIQKD